MSLWNKRGKSDPLESKKGSVTNKPLIEQVTPRAAIPGGEISISGRGLTQNGRNRPQVRFGNQLGSLLLSSSNRLVVRVPEGVTTETLPVVAPVGTTAVKYVSRRMEKLVAGTPLKVTEVEPVRCWPRI